MSASDSLAASAPECPHCGRLDGKPAPYLREEMDVPGPGEPYLCSRCGKPFLVSVSLRANLWRALVDWSWGIDLHVSIPVPLLWVYRRLMPKWMPMFYPKERA